MLLLLLQVQSKVTLKYDSWHKEVLSKFGSMLGNEMSEFHSQVSKVRQMFKVTTQTLRFLSFRVDIGSQMDKELLINFLATFFS